MEVGAKPLLLHERAQLTGHRLDAVVVYQTPVRCLMAGRPSLRDGRIRPFSAPKSPTSPVRLSMTSGRRRSPPSRKATCVYSQFAFSPSGFSSCTSIHALNRTYPTPPDARTAAFGSFHAHVGWEHSRSEPLRFVSCRCKRAGCAPSAT
jgi:hypothetical protein